jgi:hypothetical protein
LRGRGTRWSRIYSAGGDEINAKTQRRKDAKVQSGGSRIHPAHKKAIAAGPPEKPFSLASLRLCAFALKPGGGGRQMPHGFGKKDECGFLPKAATPGWK